MYVYSLGEFSGEIGDLLVLEGYRTVSKGKECIVAALFDVLAGVKLRAALSDDDFAGMDGLAAEALHAETLGDGISTELSRPARFTMRHREENKGNKAQDTAFRRECQYRVSESG